MPASDYAKHIGDPKVDIIEELKALHLNNGDSQVENGEYYHEVRVKFKLKIICCNFL